MIVLNNKISFCIDAEKERESWKEMLLNQTCNIYPANFTDYIMLAYVYLFTKIVLRMMITDHYFLPDTLLFVSLFLVRLAVR